MTSDAGGDRRIEENDWVGGFDFASEWARFQGLRNIWVDSIEYTGKFNSKMVKGSTHRI